MKTPKILRVGVAALTTGSRSAMAEGDAARDAGDMAAAAKHYARVPASDPRYLSALIQRGNMLKDLGWFDNARAAYLTAWRIDETNGDLALQLGHLGKTSGRLDDAQMWYMRATKLSGSRVEAEREVAAITRLSQDPTTYGDLSRAIDPAGSANVLSAITADAVQQGYLDVEYYRARYFSNKTTAEIQDEYVRGAAYNGRSFSSRLDAIGYTLSNRDLTDDKISASEHCRRWGVDEGRTVNPAYADFTSVDGYRPPAPQHAAPALQIGIHLHLFYPDYVARFRRFLSRFPVPFDLFVSTDSTVTQADIAPLSSLPNLKRMIVKLATNRGRNFGPMLVDFREEIAGLDLCCHLHSKKSLHSGREQVGWASYQIDHLVGDPHVVSEHLKAFSGDPALALLAPVPFWKAPYWASHWLQNGESGRILFKRLGLSPAEGFLTYPVGGMFWFRPSRMGTLFKVNWQYDDFPDELGQIDGTIQHALERAVAVIARQDGGKVLFYEPWSNKYGLDDYDMFAEYRKQGPSVILDAAACKAVTSFDVFDTVLYRRSLDTEIGKRAVANVLIAQHADAAGIRFIENRNAAEYALRESMAFAGDVALPEIYALLAERGMIGGLDPVALSHVEFEADLRDQSPRLEVVQIINTLLHRGQRVVFVSDTYYSTDQVRRMLANAGVSRMDVVFVSADMRQRKDTGRIWPLVAAQLGVGYEDIFHIGDNVVSDVQRVGDLGIQNRLVLSLLDKASYLFEANLHDPVEMDRIGALGLRPAIVAAGKSPFFSH